MRLKKSSLVASSITTLALALSAAAVLPAGAIAPPHPDQDPKSASQCIHPGFAHYGFTSLKDCLAFVAMNGQHGHGYGYGNGGHGEGEVVNINNVKNSLGDIFSHIGNVTGSVINVTVNFVTNIFH